MRSFSALHFDVIKMSLDSWTEPKEVLNSACIQVTKELHADCNDLKNNKQKNNTLIVVYYFIYIGEENF